MGEVGLHLARVGTEPRRAVLHRGTNEQRIAAIVADLNIPERVVFEFTPSKIISYDGAKLAATVPGVEDGFDKLFA